MGRSVLPGNVRLGPEALDAKGIGVLGQERIDLAHGEGEIRRDLPHVLRGMACDVLG